VDVSLRKPVYREDWPESWRLSYHYDELEMFGGLGDRAYSSAYRVRRQRTLDFVDSVAAPPATVLDVAGGQGNFTLALAARGYSVTWNDIRAELIDYVELKRETGSVHYRPGNFFELDDDPYDVVLALEVIEHVAHPDALLDRLAVLTRPGGHVILTTPNGGYFRNPLPRYADIGDPAAYEAIEFQPDASGHLWLLDEDELVQLATGAGLAVERIGYFTSPLAAGWLGLRPITERLPSRAVDASEAALRAAPHALRRRVATHLGIVLVRS
jgi:2-polyprenyl-6-hydroxyphenyl methylase/3-demethylubiquinone-9 3-methyltransferase